MKRRRCLDFVPPHPADAMDTRQALGLAMIQAKATIVSFTQNPSLADLLKIIQRHLQWSLFLAARLPNDPRWVESAKQIFTMMSGLAEWHRLRELDRLRLRDD